MSCHYAALEHESLLHLQGPDARTFLQGQVTCDIRRLSASAALAGSYCTVQGRVVCDFLLCELSPEHLVLRMRRDIRAASAALFARYIVFSRAKLEAERDDWRVVACWGAEAARQLQALFGVVPNGKYSACNGEGFALVQVDEAGEQFECYLQQGVAAEPLARIEAELQAATEPAWQALQVAAGIARIEAGTSGEFIPQMLNYDVTGHISFNKGCYTGQEVVARMHYRGKPKRRLYQAMIESTSLPAAQAPQAGAALYTGGSTQPAGNVVNCVLTGDGELALLVTATTSGIDAGLHVADADGPLLRTVDVPYPVPEK